MSKDKNKIPAPVMPEQLFPDTKPVFAMKAGKFPVYFSEYKLPKKQGDTYVQLVFTHMQTGQEYINTVFLDSRNAFVHDCINAGLCNDGTTFNNAIAALGGKELTLYVTRWDRDGKGGWNYSFNEPAVSPVKVTPAAPVPDAEPLPFA